MALALSKDLTWTLMLSKVSEGQMEVWWYRIPVEAGVGSGLCSRRCESLRGNRLNLITLASKENPFIYDHHLST